MTPEPTDDELKKLDLAPAAPLPEAKDVGKPPKVYPHLSSRIRIAMWCALIGGPIAFAMGGYELYRGIQLKSVGKEIVGAVRSSEALNTGKGRTSYQIVVDYRPPGSDTMYRKQFVVSEEEFQNAKRVGQCKVTYLPSDPTFSTVGEATSQASEMIEIGGGVFLFGVGVWWALRRQMLAAERYVMQGV